VAGSARSQFPAAVLLTAFFVSCDFGPEKGGRTLDPVDTTGTDTMHIPHNPSTPSPTYNLDSLGIPRFAPATYIGLDSIARISKFRSAAGHDYSDDFESCRSMKHYFQPRFGSDWNLVPIYAPVSGKLTRLFTESAGWQIQIRPTAQPAFTFILFHVTPTLALDTGLTLMAGQILGHHVGVQTASDVAVRVETPSGSRMVSWFDVMTDSLFAVFQARGVPSREGAVISRAARDAQPLSCNAGAFADSGSLPNWFAMNISP
jgi:hypothetical protein